MIYSQGDILLASLVFTNQAGAKRRPVMVVYDSGEDDLLIAPITSRPARTGYDVALAQWQQSGLRLPSTARVDKLATVEKSAILRQLGAVGRADWANSVMALRRLFDTIVPAQ